MLTKPDDLAGSVSVGLSTVTLLSPLSYWTHREEVTILGPYLLVGSYALSTLLRAEFLRKLFGILLHRKFTSSLPFLHSLISSVDDSYQCRYAVLWNVEQYYFILLLKLFHLCHQELFRVAPLSL